MKTAVVITGHLRSGIQNFIHMYEHFFSSHKTDVYIATWNKQENIRGGHEVIEDHLLPWKKTNLIRSKIYDIDKYNQSKELFTLDYDRKHSIEDICDLPKHQIFSMFMNESEEKIRQTHCGFYPEAIEYWNNRIKDQYYLIRQSFNLLNNYQEYDLILRTRFDFVPLSPMELSVKDDKLTVATNSPEDPSVSHYDCIQYGQPEVMKKYFHLYDHIDDFIDNLSYLNKLSYDRFNAEFMMKYYMEEYGEIKYDLHLAPHMKEHTNFILQRG